MFRLDAMRMGRDREHDPIFAMLRRSGPDGDVILILVPDEEAASKFPECRPAFVRELPTDYDVLVGNIQRLRELFIDNDNPETSS